VDQGIIASFEVKPTAFVELGCSALHPAGDRGVVHLQSTFAHHFFQISVTERLVQVPPDTQENDLSFKVTPFERVLRVHEKTPLWFLKRSRAYHITVLFATQPSSQYRPFFACHWPNRIW
jgi:hypothetical protein